MSTTLRTRSGSVRAISCAENPPIEKPSTSTAFRPSARMNAAAFRAFASMLVAGEPVEEPRPASLNRMTSRVSGESVDERGVPVVEGCREAVEVHHGVAIDRVLGSESAVGIVTPSTSAYWSRPRPHGRFLRRPDR